MIGMRLKKFSNGFFDQPKIMAAADRATRQVLSKFGAFVRTAAKSSIRKRKKTSSPGSPPSNHTGRLKQYIFFGYDLRQRSVVIGPVRLNERRSNVNVPEVLEYGGTGKVKQWEKRGGKWAKEARPIKIAPRPFMGPAFDRELPNVPELWRNSIK